MSIATLDKSSLFAAVSEAENRSKLRTRSSLLFRLRDWRDEQTWQEFYGLYRDFVYRHARGAGLNHHEAEDLVHDVFQRVAEKIGEFEAREQQGSFRRWLGNQTRWRLADKLRERRRVPGIGGDSSPPLALETGTATSPWHRLPAVAEADEEARWERDWQEQVLATAMTRLARKVSPTHLQVFQLHRVRGWSLVRIARELGLGLASVYAINSRLTKRLKAEVAILAEHTR